MVGIAPPTTRGALRAWRRRINRSTKRGRKIAQPPVIPIRRVATLAASAPAMLTSTASRHAMRADQPCASSPAQSHRFRYPEDAGQGQCVGRQPSPQPAAAQTTGQDSQRPWSGDQRRDRCLWNPHPTEPRRMQRGAPRSSAGSYLPGENGSQTQSSPVRVTQTSTARPTAGQGIGRRNIARTAGRMAGGARRVAG